MRISNREGRRRLWGRGEPNVLEAMIARCPTAAEQGEPGKYDGHCRDGENCFDQRRPCDADRH